MYENINSKRARNVWSDKAPQEIIFSFNMDLKVIPFSSLQPS